MTKDELIEVAENGKKAIDEIFNVLEKYNIRGDLAMALLRCMLVAGEIEGSESRFNSERKKLDS